MKTPAFALQLKDHTYKLKLTQPAAVKFGLPIRAKKVRSVLVNGKPAKFTIEPWAGYGMLRLEVPSTTLVEVKLDLEGESPDLAIKSEEKSEGTPGHHLVLDKIDGDVPRYQITKLHVPEPRNPHCCAKLRPMPPGSPSIFPPNSMATSARIFQQRYDSPRPETCSMRIGFDSLERMDLPALGHPHAKRRHGKRAVRGLARLRGDRSRHRQSHPGTHRRSLGHPRQHARPTAAASSTAPSPTPRTVSCSTPIPATRCA